MAGEIQLNSTSFASESGGTITINNATVGAAVAMSANQACVKTAINASGSAPIYACRAWINFDGTSASIGTGRANGNVSGVTDNGTGDYTVTFATAMPDVNYSVVCSGSMDDSNVRRGSSVGPRGNSSFNNAANSYSTSSIRILTAIYGTSSLDPTLLDLDVVNVTILR